MVEIEIYFGITAAIFGVAVIGFLVFALTRGTILSRYYLLPPVHATIAGLAYVGMALTALELLPSAVDIELLRYADWSLSTPIITYYLAMLAGVRRRTRALAVLLNAVMIWVGYASILAGGQIRWALFLLSGLLFIGLIGLYVRTFSQSISANPEVSAGLFKSLRDLTIIIWSLYPIAGALGPNGFGLMLTADHHLVIVLLDLTAKVGFMSLIVVRQYQMNTFLTAETTAAPD